MTLKLAPFYSRTITLILLVVLSVSCDRQTGSVQNNENNSRLAGTWIVESRIIDEVESPVNERFVRFLFDTNGLFRSTYRGERTQEWIQAGDGAFSYDPPLLTLHWDSGATARLLVVESGPERLIFHHGRNLAPLNKQEPDEVFSRQRTEKGPAKKPS
jgi:hypothetical protein